MKQQPQRGICALLAACIVFSAAPRARATRFADVPDTHWAAADIELCAQQGIMNGVTPTAFGLGQPLSRAACVVILNRVFQWNAEDASALPYQDIAPGAWYVSALASAYRQGVVTDQTRLFRPEEPVTRAELAAMLIRALGYSVLSGLTEPVAFADVKANAGYISLAHDMGLINGSGGLFFPDNAATREQTAAILARLYRKLYAAPRKTGIVTSTDGLWASAGLQSVAVAAGRLTGSQDAPISYTVDPDAAASLRASITATGKQALLYLSGDSLRWNALNPIANAVAEGGYAGLLLELTSSYVEASQIQSLEGLLQNRFLHLIVPAPSETDDNYPYAALGKIADSVTVRVLGQSRLVNGFPSAPVEPLEEVYRTLRALFHSDTGEAPLLNPAKCALLVSTSGSVWTGATNTGLISARDVEAMLNEEGASGYYSERYACAYLRRPASDDTPEEVVWYLDSRAVASRVRLAKLFGVGGLVVTDANGLTENLLQAFSFNPRND